MTWLRITLVLLAALAATSPAHASIQRQMFCWDPDVEFPIACAEEEEEDEGDEEAGHTPGRSITPYATATGIDRMAGLASR